MPYVINNRSNDTILIPDESLNQDYSIDLVGRNYENYGAIIATSFLDLLDNFASNQTPPQKSSSGQLWYDKNNKQLRLYDGLTGAWVPQGIMISPTAPPNDFSQNKPGVAYFNTSVNQLFVHNGLGYRESSISAGAINETSAYTGSTIGSPSSYGGRLRHIFLTDTDGVQRSVLAMVYVNDNLHASVDYYDQEKIIILFSGHTDEFTVADAASDVAGVTHNFYNHLDDGGNGIGLTIRPGINVRKDDTGRVNFATTADRALTSYKLNVGTLGADGANIDAGNVYHNQVNVLPEYSWQQLGDQAHVWANAHIGDMYVGNGATNMIAKASAGNWVQLAEEAAPFDIAYINDLVVSGNIELTSGGGTIGGPDNYIEHLYANNITANVVSIGDYVLPTEAGNANDMFVLGSTGNVIFAEHPKRINAIYSYNESITIETDIQTELDDTVNGVLLEEQNYNFVVSDSYVRGLLGSANTSNISYDVSTGQIDLTKETAFDGWEPNDFVHVGNPVGETEQLITGTKIFQERVKLDSGLTFGITNHEIQFSNNLGFRHVDDAIGENRFAMYQNGDFLATGDLIAFQTIQQLSDSRLKTNLEVIPDALEKVSQLTGYTYTRLDHDDDKKHTGLIAQDVQAVLPEAVATTQDDHLAVSYGSMMGLMVEAIKQLADQVTDLQQEIAKLKSQE
jgi:hypothetical protein